MAYTRSPPLQHGAWSVALTVKRILVIFIFIALSNANLAQAQIQHEPRLGSKCQHDMDCTDFIKGSACSANGYCECAPYFVQYNGTSCLSSQLLGGDCVLNEQCTMKVANSSCLDGACRCVEGFLQFRKHTCLGPAPPGSVCYSNAHCAMFDTRSHCDFLIPNLFGRCQCTAPTKLVRGFCADKVDVIPEVPVPTVTPTTTSTTSTTTTTKVTTTTSTTTSTPAPTTTTPEAEPTPPEPVRYDSVEEQSFSAEKIDDSPANSDADMDVPTPATQHLLTPGVTDDKLQEPETAGDDGHEATTPVAAVFDDYPYKMDEDYEQEIDDEQQQQQIMEEQEHQDQQIMDKQDEEQQQMLDNQNHMVEEEKRVEEEEQRVEDTAAEPIKEDPQLVETNEQVNESQNVVVEDTNVAETVNESVDIVEPPLDAHELEQVPVEDVEHNEPEQVIKDEDVSRDEEKIDELPQEQAADLPETEAVENEDAVKPEQVLDKTNEKEQTHEMEHVDEQHAAEKEHGGNLVDEISKVEDLALVGSDTSVAESQISEQQKDQDDQVVSADEQKVVETPTHLPTVVDIAPEEKPETNESVDETYHNETPDGFSSENLYSENHMTADEMEMYEDLEHEESGIDDTMKFDYEMAQEEMNEENTEAPIVDEEMAETDEKEPEEAKKEPQAAEKEPEVAEEEPQEVEKGPQVAEEETQLAETDAQEAEGEAQVAEKEPQVTAVEAQIPEEEPDKADEIPQEAENHPQEGQETPQVVDEASQEANEAPEKAPTESEVAAAVDSAVKEHDPLVPASYDVHEIENKNEITEQLSQEEESQLDVERGSESETPVEVEQQSQHIAENTSGATEKVENESNIADNELTADNVDTKPAFEEEQEHKDNVQNINIASHDEFTELAEAAAATTEQIAHDAEAEDVVAPEGVPNQSNSDERILDTTQVPSNENVDAAAHVEANDVIKDSGIPSIETVPQQLAHAAADATPELANEENNFGVSGATASEIEQQLVDDAEQVATTPQTVEQVDEDPAELLSGALEIEEISSPTQPPVADNAEDINEDSEVKQVLEDQSAAEVTIATTEHPSVSYAENETDKQIENQDTTESNNEDLNEIDNQFAESESHTERLEIVPATNENAAEDVKFDETELSKSGIEGIPAEKSTPVHEATLQSSSLDDLLVKLETAGATEQPNAAITEVSDMNQDSFMEEIGGGTNQKSENAKETSQFEPNTSAEDSNKQESHTEHANMNLVDNSILANEEAPHLPTASSELSPHATDAKEPEAESDVTDYEREVPQEHSAEMDQHFNSEKDHKVDQADSNFINYSNQKEEIPESGTFEEQQSIADILSDLMTEGDKSTNGPSESATELQGEEAGFKKKDQENDNAEPAIVLENTADLVAADTNIAEERLETAEAPNPGNTEHQADIEEKLITYLPESQDLSVQASNDIEIEKEPEDITNLEQQLPEVDHTQSPQDLPFDLTSIGNMRPQELESYSMVLESSTLPSVDGDDKDISGAGAEHDVGADEATVGPDDIVEITTQTLLGLASRVTLMEPAAPIVTTLKPLMVEAASESEFTPEPAKDVVGAETILANKASSEIRKRVELGSEAVSLGLGCMHDRQCQLADPNAVCNTRGVCDCATAETTESTTEAQCSAQRTGCAPGTFQCRSSGVCISWFFVCDGRPDCNDDSDEECTFNVRLNQTCPQESFQCARSGRCISRAARCDGRKQCPHGEDEVGCSALKSGQCPPNTFRCKSGECLPEYEYCNAIISCRDGSDEPPHLCGSRSMPTFFLRLLNAGGLLENEDAYCPHRCSNGRCRSTAIVCSGRDGCGDGTDEKTCSVCRCPAPYVNSSPNYLARHRPMPLW